MNIFVLCTGRCGSTTFIRACSHATNFSAGHETRSKALGTLRLAYPANHIEADCRLVWMLGRLNDLYGDQAAYVHLTRDPLDVAKSYAARWDNVDVNIVRSYWQSIHMRGSDVADRVAVGLDYVETVRRNVDFFLRDKVRVFPMALEDAQNDFGRFWDWAGAEGDKTAGLAEWSVRHNATEPESPRDPFRRTLQVGVHAVARVMRLA
jgi:hypothetical protein